MTKEQTIDKQAAQETPNLTLAQEALQSVWEEHSRHEFVTRSTEDVLITMLEDAYVNNIPVMIGGVGKAALGEYYSKYVIPQIPPDFEMVPISRTIGIDQLVDEVVAKFTHTIQMDWMLPGVAPTGKRVEMPGVVIIQFRDGKLAHVHLYWDQASILVQIGLLDAEKLPVVGADSARKLMNRNLPSNTLIDRASHSN
jgi:carboxymethylenebutenolidase